MFDTDVLVGLSKLTRPAPDVTAHAAVQFADEFFGENGFYFKISGKNPLHGFFNVELFKFV